MRTTTAKGLLAALAFTLVTACGDVPKDPEGTLERARGGVLRAGVAPAEPWITIGPDGRPAGPEAELIQAFARSIGARVEWRVGGADDLLRDLEELELDVVAAGLTMKSPWAKQLGTTRVWLERGRDKRILAVAPGENATLFALDRLIEARSAAGR